VDSIYDKIEEANPNALIADGLDGAIIGMVFRCAMQPVVLYDYDKCIEIFAQSGMGYEEYIEYMEFNVVGAYVGENGPVFLNRF
jgi:hypothetical protein